MRLSQIWIVLLLSSVGVSTVNAQTIDPPKAAPPTFSGATLAPNYGFSFPLTSLTTQSDTQTVTLKNTYLGAAWTIASVTSSDPQYAITAQTCTQAPVAKNGGTCTVTVKYVPTAMGTFTTAKIAVNRTSAGGAFWIPVTSMADAAPRWPTLPAATTFSGINQTPAQGLAFAELLPGRVSDTQTLTIKNTYLGANSTISAVASSDPTHFEVVAQTCTSMPLAKNGGSCLVSVRFKPTAPGLLSGKINFTRPTAGGNFFANLVGWGKEVNPDAFVATPAALTFPSTLVTQTSAEQVVTFKNNSASDWAITGVTSPVSTFKVAGHDCGTLVSGASCSIRLTFSPGSALLYKNPISVIRQGQKVLTFNVSGQGQTVDASTIQVSSDTVGFVSPQIKVPNEQTLTFKNVSATETWSLTDPKFQSASFSVGANTCTGVAPGASCTVQVIYTPVSTMGMYSQGSPGLWGLTQRFASGKSQPVTLKVWTDTPRSNDPVRQKVEASPGLIQFPDTLVGSTAEATVTLTNVSPNEADPVTGVVPPAYLGTITSYTSWVTVKANTCPQKLMPGESCAITLTFAPKNAATQTGSLAMSISDMTLQWKGTGKTPLSHLAVTLPAALEHQVVGVSQTVFARMVNDGVTAVTVKAIQASGPVVAETNCVGILNGGASCLIGLKVTPDSLGTVTGTLTIDHSASSSPYVGAISVTADSTIPPALEVTLPEFSPFAVGELSQTRKVVLRNGGGGALRVSGVSTDSPVVADAACNGVQLLQGEACTTTVTATPSTAGTWSSTLAVFHSASSAPYRATLRGSTALASLAYAYAGYAFPNSTAIGESRVATKSLIVSNPNSVVIPLAVATGDAAVTEFFLQSNSCAGGVPAQSSCEIRFVFKPREAGLRAQSVTLTAAYGEGLLVTTPIGLSGLADAQAYRALAITPSTVSFGVLTNTPSTQLLTVTNTGNAAVPLNFPAFSFADSVFTSASSCPTKLNTGDSCLMTITAVANGQRSTHQESVTVNASVAVPVTVNVTATELLPFVPTTQTAAVLENIQFGEVLVGVTKELVLEWRNPNGQPAQSPKLSTTSSELAVTSECPATTLAQDICRYRLSYAPATTGLSRGSLTLTPAGGPEQRFDWSGYGVATATFSGVDLPTAGLDFGPLALGATQTKTLTFKNSGTTSAPGLQIQSTEASPAALQFVNGCADSIAAGATCVVTVSATALRVGVAGSTFTLYSTNGYRYQQGWSVQGLDAAGTLVSLGDKVTTLSWGVTWANGDKTLTIPFINQGVTAFSGLSVAVADPTFEVTNGCAAAVAPGARCDVLVKAKPTRAGLFSSSLTYQIPGAPAEKVVLSGEAKTPVELAFGGPMAVLSFGKVYAGAPKTVSLEFKNNSPYPVAGFGEPTDVPAQLQLVNECSAGLSPGASCRLVATLMPSAQYMQMGSFPYRLPYVSTPSTIYWDAKGYPPLMPDNPLQQDDPWYYPSIAVGATVTLSHWFKNYSEVATSSGLEVIGLPPGMALTNGCQGPINPGARCEVRIAFTPTQAGKQSGVVQYKMPYLDNLVSTYWAADVAAKPPLQLSSPSSQLNFGEVPLGITKTLEVAYVNSATTPAQGLSVYDPGKAGLVIDNGCQGEVPAGGTCTVKVSWTPASVGLLAMQLLPTVPPGTAPLPLLSGSAVSALVLTTAVPRTGIDFGEVPLGTVGSATLRFSNIGGQAVPAPTVTKGIGKAIQVQNGCPAQMAPETQCEVLLQVAPTDLDYGAISGTVVVAGKDLSQTIAWAGLAAYSFYPTSPLPSRNTDFGSVAVGASQSLTVEFLRDGTRTVPGIEVLNDSPDVAITNGCAGSVAGGTKCTIGVAYRPTHEGALTGSFAFKIPGMLYTVNWKGIGVSAP